MYLDPEHISQWKLITTIRPKKETKGVINYLTIDGMRLLLSQIDITNQKGRRNLTLLSFLYNTAVRVQELIDLTPSNLRLEKPFAVEVMGKGSKKRLVPLDESLVNLLTKYMSEYGLNDITNHNRPLF